MGPRSSLSITVAFYVLAELSSRRLGVRVARGIKRRSGPAVYLLARAWWRYGGFPGSTSGSGAAGAGTRAPFFWGWRDARGLCVRTMADRSQHGEGQHHQRDMPVPAMPGPGFIVVQPEFVLRRLKAVLNRPTMAFNLDQGPDRGSRRTPGGEERHIPVGKIAPDQQPTCPGAGLCAVIFRCVALTPST